MTKLYEKKEHYSVNPATGIPGVVKTVEELLRRVPRIQSVSVSLKNLKSGKGIECIRHVTDPDEETPLRIDLGTLTPAHVLGNCEQFEEIFLHPTKPYPLEVISRMLSACNRDQLAPIAWVISGNNFWSWLETNEIFWKNKEDFFGYTVYNDISLPQDVLVLCAADSYACNLVDTRKAYKLLMPWKVGSTDFGNLDREIDPLEESAEEDAKKESAEKQ